MWESICLTLMATAGNNIGKVLQKRGTVILPPLSLKLKTRGLKHGRAIVVSTCASVASIITGVLTGMIALGEKLPSAPLSRLLLLLGWLFVIVGVILLVSSTRMIALLGRPLRGFLRGGYERNRTLRRTTSIRAKDPNPSTVMHTSTLHHLIPASAKEKP